MTTPTITQNGALYIAQHNASKNRATLFHRLCHPVKRKSARLRPQRQVTFDDGFLMRLVREDRSQFSGN